MLHAHTRMSNHVEYGCDTAAEQYLHILLHSAPICQQPVMHVIKHCDACYKRVQQLLLQICVCVP